MPTEDKFLNDQEVLKILPYCPNNMLVGFDMEVSLVCLLAGRHITTPIDRAHLSMILHSFLSRAPTRSKSICDKSKQTTALQLATARGNLEAVKILLSFGKTSLLAII